MVFKTSIFIGKVDIDKSQNDDIIHIKQIGKRGN